MILKSSRNIDMTEFIEKLIEKKKCGDKLTEEEEEKLKCYFKELK